MTYRPVRDSDIAAYSAYRRKLAEIASPGDPPPHRFSAWFHSRYHALPLDELVSDRSAERHRRQLAVAGGSPGADRPTRTPEARPGELRQRAIHGPLIG